LVVLRPILYEAEMLHRAAAGHVQVVAEAIFALLPNTRVSQTSMGYGEVLKLKV